MSMSTNVYGFVPPDDNWKAMKKVWDACKSAGVDIPNKVDKFFNYQDPDPAGTEIDIPYDDYSDDSRSGIEISVSDIPANVKIIRFVNSW